MGGVEIQNYDARRAPILSKGKLGLYLAAWLPVGSLLASLAKLSTRGAAPRPPFSPCRSPSSTDSSAWGRGRSAARCRSAGAASFGSVRPGRRGGRLERPVGPHRRRVVRDPGAKLPGFGDSPALPARHPLFFSAGVFLYLLSATLHYLLIAFEASREARRRRSSSRFSRGTRSSVRSRAGEAALPLQQPQLDQCPDRIRPPGREADVPAARRFPATERRPRRQAAIPLGDEAASPARSSPSNRSVRKSASASRSRWSKPRKLPRPAPSPSAPRRERRRPRDRPPGRGGTVRLRARLAAGRLEILVENPCDPERPASPRRRGRPGTYGRARRRARLRARLEVESEPERFRVTILLPAPRARRAMRGRGGPSGPRQRGAGLVTPLEGSRIRVVVVDDEALARRSFANIFRATPT